MAPIILVQALLASAHAQPPPVTPTIVVTGQRAISEDAVHAYVEQASTAYEGQLARFHDPVCPQVIGMEPQSRSAIVSRIREVARTARIRVAGERCAPNLTIVLDRNPHAFITRLSAARPNLFAGMTPSQVRNLEHADAPAIAWRTTEIQNEDGRGPGLISSSLSTVSGPRRIENPSGIDARSSSIIPSQTQRAIVQSFVVFDSRAALGKSLVQIADYAALRGLAPVATDRGIAADTATILNLFRPGAVAAGELSPVDLAYLIALYRVSATRSALQQRAQISAAILEQLNGRR